MGALRDFVADMLESEGAAIEPVEPDGLEVLASEPLRAAMGWPEFARLGFAATLPTGAIPIGLEGDWLDRFGALLGERGRFAERQLVVAGNIAAPSDPQRLLDRALDLPNAVWRLHAAKPTWTRCLLLAFRYTAISDEKREGLVWLWKQPLIRFMAILTGGYNLIFPGFTLITIVLAQHQHASSLTIGLIFAAGGIGAIVGAIFASFLQKRLSFAQAIIGATCLIAIATPLYAIAPNAVALGAVAAFSAVIGPLYNVVQFSYRLALIPDALQGRVNSVFRLIAFGGQPLGLALTGILIQNVGVISTILLCTAGLGILAVATIANRHVRNAR